MAQKNILLLKTLLKGCGIPRVALSTASISRHYVVSVQNSIKYRQFSTGEFFYLAYCEVIHFSSLLFILAALL